MRIPTAIMLKYKTLIKVTPSLINVRITGKTKRKREHHLYCDTTTGYDTPMCSNFKVLIFSVVWLLIIEPCFNCFGVQVQLSILPYSWTKRGE